MNKKYKLLIINDFLSSSKARLTLSLVFKRLLINTISFAELINEKANGIVIIVDSHKVSPGIICDLILEIRILTDTPIWILKDTRGTVERKLYLEAGVENCFDYSQSPEEIEKIITNLLDRLTIYDVDANNNFIREVIRKEQKNKVNTLNSKRKNINLKNAISKYF